MPWNMRKYVHNQMGSFNFSKLDTAEPWKTSNWSHTDLTRLRTGMVGAQFWSAYVPCGAQFLDAVQLTLEQIDVIKRLAEMHPDSLRIATTVKAIRDAHQGGQIASLIGVEGGHTLGNSLAVLRMYYGLGARYLTLTHTCDTPCAAATATAPGAAPASTLVYPDGPPLRSRTRRAPRRAPAPGPPTPLPGRDTPPTRRSAGPRSRRLPHPQQRPSPPSSRRRRSSRADCSVGEKDLQTTDDSKKPARHKSGLSHFGKMLAMRGGRWRGKSNSVSPLLSSNPSLSPPSLSPSHDSAGSLHRVLQPSLPELDLHQEYDVIRSLGEGCFARLVVKEMNRLGMMIDLSHASVRTMEDTLNVTQAPLVFSHSSARTICNSTRNVPDEILQQVANNGGIVMVNFYTYFVTCNHTADLQDVINHINHIRKVAGTDHVGIGAGYDGINKTPRGLEDVSKYPDLLATLLADPMWTEDDVKKLAGGNLLRVFSAVEEVRDKWRLAAVPPSDELIGMNYLEGKTECLWMGS
ncbi:hypothetical protein FOCC_FOCC014095 [Frankliniella occidentalis]|nr:hypothetical protein FOCC_FOCC014095 [Frankliniella occidentalis]